MTWRDVWRPTIARVLRENEGKGDAAIRAALRLKWEQLCVRERGSASRLRLTHSRAAWLKEIEAQMGENETNKKRRIPSRPWPKPGKQRGM